MAKRQFSRSLNQVVLGCRRLERLALLHRLIECGVDLSGALISAGLLCNLEYMQVLAEIGKANPSESRSNGDAPLHLLAADAPAD